VSAPSWAIWVTGLPGSGKSAVARALAARLQAAGEPVTVLELDVLRRTITPEPTYSDAEREVVYRSLVHFARLLTRHGVPVIIDATGHRRAWRDLARATIPHFAEVQLVCPLEVARERERARTAGHAPRGIYAAAGRPGATVPGVDVAYEPAEAPELTVDTAAVDVAAAAAQIEPLARRLGREAPARRPRGTPAWAMWITGLPGSGKSTLADAVAGLLAERGIEAEVLAVDDLRRFVVPHGAGAPAVEDALHRALVCAARLLTEAGVPVIIDATAPRRVWRELARTLIGRYAEVQLECPPALCRARERAVRWNPVLCAHGPARAAIDEGPELALDYERGGQPALTIHTHVRDVWSATQDIERLARRLHRDASR